MQTWQIQEAKSRFSEVVKRAQNQNMSYLLDTNVISELVRPNPAKIVMTWFENIPSEALRISVLALVELRKGVERMPDDVRREKLRLWLEHELADWFGRSVLHVDIAVAERWGQADCANRSHRSQHRQPAGSHRPPS